MGRRRNPPRRHQPLPPLTAVRRVEIGPDGYDYDVRPVPAARALKNYRCPGCDHEIGPGIAHVVVWPSDVGEAAVDDRRHWHTPCWSNRRSPTRKWS
ncbi:hypothetical protein MMAD_40280 [Mycolicibacterium madagascariense]|uniref:ATP/GTP-binding protein n=1 Tax=Mycolicibacterium madagascariense TaxID=212765 RepID=A0A7I7XKX3_9MYCO|nr:hypothetical protein [Mycolicibacterium madagascariense]MCV7012223.1 hypothetical protein [Mycolicibacterium madagascariense]BBZ29733.1 hypothetical protein MMAD_40280 [Mycolicibacterium madagascariense]